MNAATYEVGVGKAYANLEELRQAAADGKITWENWEDWENFDKIVLYGDDQSLTGSFSFDENWIFINGTVTIKPANTSNIQFSSGNNVMLGFDDSSSIIFDGFKSHGGSGGGAIYSNEYIEIYGNSTFSNNTATNGGAIYSNKYAEIYGNYTFSNNIATNNGGAIYSNNNTVIYGNNIFSDNTATNGGAIYSNEYIVIYGNNTFSNNTATSNGGAIYSNGDTRIIASGGNIIFKGNKANNIPNAIYMFNDNNNRTLSLAATEGNNVQFYDPIKSNVANPNLTIKINENSYETGTVFLDMSNHNGTDKNSDIYGNTTIYRGTFALKGEAVYGANGNTGDFTLENNATLLAVGKGNKINSNGNVSLNGTIAFDLTGVTTETLLTFNKVPNDTEINNIDIRTFNSNGTFSSNDTFKLAETTNGTFKLAASSTLTTHGENITDTRASSTSLSLINSNKTLQITAASTQNGTVTWTGNASDNIWNATSENWNGNIGGTVTKFLHGDDVVFSDTSRGNLEIEIQDSGVTIGNRMMIEGNGIWTFTGGEIEGGTINIADNANTEIYFDTRRMNQRIEIGQNATAVIASLEWEMLTFTDFNYNGNGGAISGNIVTISGNNVFSNNKVIDNGYYGGAIDANKVTIFGSNIFSNNTAISGGAISSDDVTVSGNNTFSYNIAEFGGAISSNLVAISGNNVFSNNNAYYGGAIGSDSVTINGVSTFANNTANVEGGAIYSDYNATITASGGDILFKGNKANNSQCFQGVI